MQRFFIDAQGYLLGSYDGPDPSPFGEDATALDHGPTDGRMRWDGAVWCLNNADLMAAAADKRWRVETGGKAVGGIRFLTDRESRTILRDAQELSEETGTPVRWKAPDGHVTVTAAQIKSIRLALGAFVTACFDAEEAMQGLIALGQITTVDQIESWEGWPSNE